MRILKKAIGTILIIAGLILIIGSIGMLSKNDIAAGVTVGVISVLILIGGGKLIHSAKMSLPESERPTTKGSFKDFLVKYKTGVPGMVKPTSCTMRITASRVEFIKRGKVRGSVGLASISGADVYKESELIAAVEKNKSVVGRAAVGTVLLGPLGLILGGMSGVGKKTIRPSKEKKTWFFAFTYNDQGITDTALVEIEGVFSNEKRAYRAKNELLERVRAGMNDK